jgi:hypothetical protein
MQIYSFERRDVFYEMSVICRADSFAPLIIQRRNAHHEYGLTKSEVVAPKLGAAPRIRRRSRPHRQGAYDVKTKSRAFAGTWQAKH